MTSQESHHSILFASPRWIAHAALTIGIVTGCAVLLSATLSLANLAFLFLLPVIFVSGRNGLVPGLLTAAFSATAFNFFLVPPRFTLHVEEADNVVTLFILLAVAFAVSNFAARLQGQATLARQNAADSDSQARLALDLSAQTDEAAMRNILVHALEVEAGCTATVIPAGGDTALLSSASPFDVAAADWALAHGDPAGKGTEMMGGADSLYVPGRSGKEVTLMVRLWRDGTLAPVPPDRLDFVRSLADRCADAIERFGVTATRQALETRAKQDAMRDALLASFSHDMRTPLTTVTSALSGLVADPTNGDALAAAQAGAGRLEWLFANLADLARIKAGAVNLRIEAIDLTDTISAALDAMKTEIGERVVHLDIPATTPLIRSDARLLHHMLVNLIDNACKYGGENETLEIAVRTETDGVMLVVKDSGPGIGEVDSVSLFQPYIRGVDEDAPSGQGLGLAIVAGFAKALEIKLSASNRADRAGASFELRFPDAMVVTSGEEVQA